MIPYGELVNATTSIALSLENPQHRNALSELLADISKAQEEAGNGMLSAVVVFTHGSMEPGPGFFELARALNKDTSDILKCWVTELHRVHAVWSKGSREVTAS